MLTNSSDIRLLVSPWTDTFEAFARSINSSALVAAPFITAEPLARLRRHLQSSEGIHVEILTNLSVDSMIQGSTDPRAIASFCDAIPATKVRHLPGLHAKAYIADRHTAIITSSNLTVGGLTANYEYGIQIKVPDLVEQISRDIEGYGVLGADVTLTDLNSLAEITKELQENHVRLLKSARQQLREEFEKRVTVAQDAVLALRANSAQSTNAIFSRTLLFLLGRGPLSTKELHPLIQNIHPDLCDDTIDRVINGVHFGKWWKHMVRNAQQSLQQRRLVKFDGSRWHLTAT